MSSTDTTDEADEVQHRTASLMNNIMKAWDPQQGLWYAAEVRGWSDEARQHFYRLAQHNMKALNDIIACRSVADVLAIERALIEAHSSAWLAYGQRLSKRMGDAAISLQNNGADAPDSKPRR